MINAIGCLVLAAVVFTQWGKESRVDAEMTKLRVDLATAKSTADRQATRAAKRVASNDSLSTAIAVLKESFEATRLAAAAEQRANRAAVGESVDHAHQQIESWKLSLVGRDARIRDLEADLALARNRLDEAIVRLKQFEAR
jgi:multidrug resistance efflux pump